MSEEAELFELLPEQLQQRVLRYQPLEGKLTTEIRNIMHHMRREWDIPPWHLFTAYMKACAKGSLCGRNYAKENVWVTMHTNRDMYVADAQMGTAEGPWVSFKINVIKGGDLLTTFEVAAKPSADLVWNIGTEGIVAESVRATRLKNGVKAVVLSKKWIMDKANELLEKDCWGYTQCVVTYEIRDFTKHAVETKMPWDDQVKKLNKDWWKEPKSAITASDGEMFLTMIDLLKQLMLERGMEKTYNRWEKRINELLGKTDGPKSE